MKLVIQIPCYNESKTLPATISALPREVGGFESVEWLLVDDGSSDDSVTVAREHGVDHVVSHPRNQGLARTFMTGLSEAIRLGADVIVTTDADNQYDAACIPALVAPILAGECDIAIGARPIDTIEHFSPVKKSLQRLGSWVVRKASGTEIQDAPSGFRAISREAALHLEVFTSYTYTLETIIQSGYKNLAVSSVPVAVNEDLRPSRLVRSIPGYVLRSMGTIVRVFLLYRSFALLLTVGILLMTAGFLLGVRYLYFFFIGEGAGHVQSVILMSILTVVGFQTVLFAVLIDLISTNRRLLERLTYFAKKQHWAGDGVPKDGAMQKEPGSGL